MSVHARAGTDEAWTTEDDDTFTEFYSAAEEALEQAREEEAATRASCRQLHAFNVVLDLLAWLAVTRGVRLCLLDECSRCLPLVLSMLA